MVFKIAIIADSRGGFLQHFFVRNNVNNGITYRTFILKGRKIEDLWSVAITKLETGNFDRVYILGGICNITSPYYDNNIRYFWPLRSVRDLIDELCQIIGRLTNDTLHLGKYGKLVFLPEVGADLIMYNNIEFPQPWMLQAQYNLRRYLPRLHDAVRNANHHLGAQTPWDVDTVFGRTKKGELYPKYELLYDGLHPSPPVAGKIAKQIMKDANDFVGR